MLQEEFHHEISLHILRYFIVTMNRIQPFAVMFWLILVSIVSVYHLQIPLSLHSQIFCSVFMTQTKIPFNDY